MAEDRKRKWSFVSLFQFHFGYITTTSFLLTYRTWVSCGLVDGEKRRRVWTMLSLSLSLCPIFPSNGKACIVTRDNDKWHDYECFGGNDLSSSALVQPRAD
ncbi:hypothetical protein VNO77_16640 [Canavalia gladiata]|uniref:Uncharacterized protein n=1 Tax=Canavalia gladiata TaxID=3824 RepID=A0AAN9QHZ4_CANGL